jgi:hypothetical protein
MIYCFKKDQKNKFTIKLFKNYSNLKIQKIKCIFKDGMRFKILFRILLIMSLLQKIINLEDKF